MGNEGPPAGEWRQQAPGGSSVRLGVNGEGSIMQLSVRSKNIDSQI